MLLLAGWAFEHRAGHQGLNDSAMAALERLVLQGLPCRTMDAGRCFDPVEVLNFLKWRGLSGADAFWADRFVSTGRRLVEESTAPRGPSVQEVTVAFQRTFSLEGVPRDKAVRFRLPLPVPHASLARFRVDVTRSDGLRCTLARDGCRLEARGVPPDQGPLTVGALLHLTVDHSVPDRDPEGLDQYLQWHEDLIQVTPRVQSASVALAGALKGRREIVERFFNFFLDHLCLGAVHYDQVEVVPAATDWVLDSGWFDCQLGSALLAALCRARGIPARLVGGFLLYPVAPTPHFWTEIWFDDAGWLPFDLNCWDLSAGGRDIGWRHHFAGRVDMRLTTQRMPRQFTGSPGVPIRSGWHVLSAATPTGARTGLYAIEEHRLIYEDQVEVIAERDVPHHQSSVKNADQTACWRPSG